MPNKVETVINALENSNFVHSDAVIVDDKLNVIVESHDAEHKVKRGFIPNLLRSRYLGCCMAFDRKVLDSVFPVPCYTNDYPHDLWIALVAERYFSTRLINEPLILYRRHNANASDGGQGQNSGFFAFIKKVLIRFYYLYYVNLHKKYVKH